MFDGKPRNFGDRKALHRILNMGQEVVCGVLVGIWAAGPFPCRSLFRGNLMENRIETSLEGSSLICGAPLGGTSSQPNVTSEGMLHIYHASFQFPSPLESLPFVLGMLCLVACAGLLGHVGFGGCEHNGLCA